MENWMNFMKDNQLNWCNWSIITKDEPSSVLIPSSSSLDNWTESDLTTIGKKVKNYMLNWPNWTPFAVEPCTLKTAPFVTMNLPGIVEAENFDAGCPDSSYHDTEESNQGGKYRTNGVDIESCTDAGGGFSLGYMDKGEWLNYTVNIKETGTYKVTARVASMSGGGSLRLQLDGANLTNEIAIPSTGDWQNWEEVSLGEVSLTPKTAAKLKLLVTKSGFNLNKISFENLVSGIEDASAYSSAKVYPTVSESKFYVETTQKIEQISAYNMSGIIVFQRNNVQDNQFSFGESFAKGAYVVVLNLKDGSSVKYKIQKQ
jgi:hypothetical protein